eukprot:10860162-Alexandrium_andersonii.AAC.1
MHGHLTLRRFRVAEWAGYPDEVILARAAMYSTVRSIPSAALEVVGRSAVSVPSMWQWVCSYPT